MLFLIALALSIVFKNKQVFGAICFCDLSCKGGTYEVDPGECGTKKCCRIETPAPTKSNDGGGNSGGNVLADQSIRCNCLNRILSPCRNLGPLTNIKLRLCMISFTGPDTCNGKWDRTPFQYESCSGATPTPTITPVGATYIPTLGANNNCKCQAGSCPSSNCVFDRYPNVAYSQVIKCGLAKSFFQSPPTNEDKNSWCRASKRTKGDANSDGIIDLMDYFYFVRAKSGAKIPASVNPDFNGDNEIRDSDRTIIIKTLK